MQIYTFSCWFLSCIKYLNISLLTEKYMKRHRQRHTGQRFWESESTSSLDLILERRQAWWLSRWVEVLIKARIQSLIEPDPVLLHSHPPLHSTFVPCCQHGTRLSITTCITGDLHMTADRTRQGELQTSVFFIRAYNEKIKRKKANQLKPAVITNKDSPALSFSVSLEMLWNREKTF